MYYTIKRFAVLCFIPLLLSACLPGDSESQKSLDRTSHAATTIQAEQIAASMINTATRLVMSDSVSNLDSDDLKAQICQDKVIAYIPKTAKITRNDEVPQQIAQHMRSYLESKLGKERVSIISQDQSSSSNNDEGGLTALSACYQNIATNSPVIVMDMNMAQTIQTPENDDGIIAISMEPCGDNQPGVIIKRTHEDGTIETEEHCGASAPTDLPEIILAQGQIADWKKRLAGETDAMRNVVCIATDDGCTPLDNTMATEIVCPAEDDRIEFIANPLFDTSDYTFKPDPMDVSCGRGWTGELTARVKSKVCKVVRNGQEVDEKPAKVFDIAYIGAQCHRDDVFLYESCPAGYPNSAEGRVVTKQNIRMIRPITLTPLPDAVQQGVNHSELAYRTNSGATNMSQDILDLVADSQSGGITVKRPSGETNNFKLFYSSANLGEADAAFGDSSDPSFVFNHRFAEQIAAQNESPAESGGPAGIFDNVICYGAAQNCKNGMVPEMMAIVVDRSGSMTANVSQRIMPTQTSCRATMANLFQTQPRFNACTAAKDWHNLLGSKEPGNLSVHHQKRIDLLATVPAAIAAGRDPVDYIANDLFSQFMTYICQQDGLTNCTDGAQFGSLHPALGGASTLTAQLNGKITQMRLSLRQPNTYLPRLRYGLMIGHDCYPANVRDDSYGSCAPVFANATQLAASDYTSDPLRTCQSSCPGECITDAVERVPEFVQTGYDIYPTAANVPQDYQVNRMQLVDSFVQSNLIPNLPYGIKFFYTEFIQGNVDSKTHANVGRRPVSFIMGDPDQVGNYTPDENSMNQTVDMSHWIRELYKEMKIKFDARNAMSNGYAYGVTPLYKATYEALKELQEKVLNDNPDAVAALVVLTDGEDNGGDPPNYFRNLCGISSKGGFNQSLVKYIGDNYPNLKLFYLHIGSSSSELNACNTNHTYNGTKIVHAFHHDENAANALHHASNAIAGANDNLPPEIGQQVCIDKYGANITISNEPIDGHMPARPLNHSSHVIASCEGYAYLDINNSDAYPPFNLRNRLMEGIPTEGVYNPYHVDYAAYGMPGDETCSVPTDGMGGMGGMSSGGSSAFNGTGGMAIGSGGAGYRTMGMANDDNTGGITISGRGFGLGDATCGAPGPVCTGDIDPITYEVCGTHPGHNGGNPTDGGNPQNPTNPQNPIDPDPTDPQCRDRQTGHLVVCPADLCTDGGAGNSNYGPGGMGGGAQHTVECLRDYNDLPNGGMY